MDTSTTAQPPAMEEPSEITAIGFSVDEPTLSPEQTQEKESTKPDASAEGKKDTGKDTSTSSNSTKTSPESNSKPKDKADSKEQDKSEGKPQDNKPFNPFESADKTDKKQASPAQESDYKERFESTRKEYLRASQQLTHAQKAVETLAKDQDWDKDTTDKLKELFTFQGTEDVAFLASETPTPIQKIMKLTKNEIPTYKKYTSDEQSDKYFAAFERWYWADASQEDQALASDILEKLTDDPAALTKEIARVGKNIYDHVYRKIEESGGLYGLFSAHAGELAAKDKEIETLTKQLDGFKKRSKAEEDYLPSTGMTLPETSSKTGESGRGLLESAW